MCPGQLSGRGLGTWESGRRRRSRAEAAVLLVGGRGIRGWNNGGAAGGEKRAGDGGGGLGRALSWAGGTQRRVGLWTPEQRLPQGAQRVARAGGAEAARQRRPGRCLWDSAVERPSAAWATLVLQRPWQAVTHGD